MASEKPADRIFLAGDIGGTHARLALAAAAKRRPTLREVRVFPSAEYEALEDLLAEFLEGRRQTPAAACFGIAGPVSGGRSRATNLPWTVSEKRISRRFRWPKVRLVNDLVAAALAVPVLRAQETETLLSGRPERSGNRIVVAPGTGFGQSILVAAGKEAVPVASEGGHADFAPASESDIALWRFLHRRYGHVSMERVLSGAGLAAIYQWLKQSGRKKEPKWLAHKMKEDDPAAAVSSAAIERNTPIAVDALSRFVFLLGAAAGNFALTASATGGVYIGGGIAPKILPFLRKEAFSEGFLSKGRFREFLERVPVRVILNDRVALLGAARCAAGYAS